MIKALCVLIAFLLMPLPMTLLLKSLNRDFKWTTGYITGSIVNLIVFYNCILGMADEYDAPSTLPVKRSLLILILILMAFISVVVVRCVKAKKWIGFSALFYMTACDVNGGEKLTPEVNKVHFLWWTISRSCATIGLFVLAFILYIACAYRIVSYMPIDGLRRLADVNRLDSFGFVISDFSVMIAYYLNRLLGIPAYYTICVILPLVFFVTVVVLLYDIADVLFGKDKFNVCLCGAVEAIMILVGDCNYSQVYLMLHGMLDVQNVMIILAVPTVFMIGLRLYFYEEKLVKHSPEIVVAIIVIVACYLADEKSFALAMMNVVVIVLLFIGRRYLPWLQPSN